MLMEIDQVAVDKVLWQRAVAGDMQAKNEIRSMVNGLCLYMHAMPVKDSEIVITLHQLDDLNLVDEIRCVSRLA